MASRFPSEPNVTCEGCDSNFRQIVRCRVEVKQNLCIDCACKRQVDITGVEKDVKWFCYKHKEEEAKVFCETHEKSICHVCAVTSDHKPCQTKCIGDVISDRKHRLADLKKQCKDKEDTINQEVAIIDQQSLDIANDLQRVKCEILTAIEEETWKVETKMNEMTTKINQEADEEIKKINEKREQRLKQNQDRQDLLDKIKRRGSFLEEKMEWTVKQFQQSTERHKNQIRKLSLAVYKACEDVDEVLTDDTFLMADFNDTIRSLTKCLQRNIKKGGINDVRQIAKNVLFVRIFGQEIGHIDGVDEMWEECYNVGWNGHLAGTISDYETVIEDKSTRNVSVMNLRDKSRNRMDNVFIGKMKCCSPLSDPGRIVFGTSDGNIVICDRTWKVITRIGVKAEKQLHVSVDKDGMILAVAIGDPIIYVYNPDSGSLVRRIEVRVQHMREVHDLSSGDMVVRCSDNVYIIDGSGTVKHTLKPPQQCRPVSLQVDRSCDLIYIACHRTSFMLPTVRVHVYSNGTLISENVSTENACSSCNPCENEDLTVILQAGMLIVNTGKVITINRRTRESLVERLQRPHKINHNPNYKMCSIL